MAGANRLRDSARILLACIRLFNGVAALFVPGMLYVFRMFGIRTVLIGAELLVQTGERRDEATRRAILIHASDTVAAFLATISGNFPKNGRIIVVISAVNTVLAVIANRH